MPEEKQVLHADQYVVKLLGERENEIAKLQDKYDELLKRFVVLQVELDKFTKVKEMFVCEPTVTGNGYSINFKDGNCRTSLKYSWQLDPSDQPRDFQELLDLLGLELPKVKENK